MQRSASPTNTTTPVESRLSRADAARLVGLIASYLTLAGGVIALAVLLAKSGPHSATSGEIVQIAMAVVASISGLLGVWTFTSAQSAAERAAKAEEQRDSVTDQLAQLQSAYNGLSDVVDKFIGVETAQSERSREARERLERMERSLIAIDAKLADAEAFGQHLVTLADRMEALEKRQEEMLNLEVARADADRTTLTAMIDQLREDIQEAVKEAKAAGYVHAIDRRVNGSRTGLQLVDPER